MDKRTKKIYLFKFLFAFILIFISTVVVLFIEIKQIEMFQDTEKTYSYRRVGNPQAKILIIEYSDFACPACAKMNEYLKNLIKYFSNDFEINFKHYPLISIHPYSFDAAVWVECAGIESNKFFEVGDLLFKNQKEWSNSKDYLKYFEKYTVEVKGDLEKIKRCYNSIEASERVKKDIEKAEKLRIDSTPTFFVNGKKAVGGWEFIEAIKEAKK